MGPTPTSLDKVIAEMLSLQKALPKRPSLPELEIAISTIAKIDEALITSQRERLRDQRPEGVPVTVFTAFQEMRLEAAEHRAKDQKQLAEALVELEERHRKYDNWIRKVHAALSGTVVDADADADADADGDAHVDVDVKGASGKVESAGAQGSARSVLDATWEFPPSESSVTSSVGVPTSSVDGPSFKPSNNKFSAYQRSDSFSRVAQSLSWNKEQCKPDTTSGEQNAKVSLLSMLAVDGTETSGDESNSLVLHKDEGTAGVLSMLDAASSQKETCLDLRGALLQEIEWVPESIGKMTWLTNLNLSGNRLAILPDSIGDLINLVNMDLSLNQLVALPETIGQLACLKTLILDNNKIEELPYTIGECTSLIELTASFNQLKALPEATGKLTQLRCLDVHWNKLGSLPSTIGSMTSLVDLDASFNEIRHIPAGLCHVTTLTRLNLASNFNELQELPQDIGNLQKLKVLNLSCNQLKVLPDSFALLSNLQDLDLSGNYLRVPPRHIVDQGTEAVLKYMADLVAEKGKGESVVRKKSLWTFLFFSCGKPSVVESDFIPR